MILHTVGDSHSLFVWENISLPWLQVVTHHVGPRTMFRFGQDKLALADIQKFGVKNGEAVVFCWGEIDCRAHVYLHREEGVKAVLNRIADSYFTAIRENVSRYQRLTVGVFNVVPPRRYVKGKRARDMVFEGTDEERQQYVLRMNVALRARCVKAGYLFVDVYDSYCDEEGFLRMELSDKRTHIIAPQPMEEFLTRRLKER